MKKGVSNMKMAQPDIQDTGIAAPRVDCDVSGVLMLTDRVTLLPDEPLTQNMFFSESQNKNLKIIPCRRKMQRMETDILRSCNRGRSGFRTLSDPAQVMGEPYMK